MLLVISLWILVIIVGVSFGNSVLQFINLKINLRNNVDNRIIHSINIFESFILGIFLITLILGYGSILFPINLVFKILLLVGILILNLKYGSLYKTEWDYFKKELYQTPLLFKTIGFAILLFSAYTASEYISEYDTGLYHTQAMNWIESYSLIPGLGNLHGRFAFNPMSFFPCSFFTFHYGEILIYPLNGAIYILFTFHLLRKVQIAYQRDQIQDLSFYLIIIILFIPLVVHRLSGASPDVICAILVIYSLDQLRMFLEKNVLEKKENHHFDIQIIFIISIVYMTVIFKLSTLFLVIIIPFFWKNYWKKGLQWSFLLGVLIFFPFIYRNVLLSGYLVYPFPELDFFNFDWKIPQSSALAERDLIKSWALIGEESKRRDILNLSFMEQLKLWWNFPRLNFILKGIFLINLCLLGNLLLGFLKKDKVTFILSFCLVINLSFWIFNAPDPRFAYGFLFFGMAWNISSWIKYFKKIPFFRELLVMMIPLVLLGSVFIFIKKDKIKLKKNFTSKLIYPQPKQSIDLESRTTNFKYFIPKEGDKCFDAALPCTPFDNPSLYLRGKDLKDGFRINRKEKK